MAERKSPRVGKNGRQSVEPFEPKRARATKGAPAPSRRAQASREQARPRRKAESTSTPNQQRERAKRRVRPKVKRETETHMWFALLFAAISLYLFVACVSYLFYWELDAHMAQFSVYFSDAKGEVHNYIGPIGAIFAEFIIGKWLGIMGLLIPVFFAMWAVRLLNLKRLTFRRSMVNLLLIAFVGSLALGHFGGVNRAVFGSGWGGASGIYMSEQISSVMGSDGTTILVIFLIISVLYFCKGRFIKRTILNLRRGITQRSAKRAEAQQRAAEREEMRQGRINFYQDRDSDESEATETLDIETSKTETPNGEGVEPARIVEEPQEDSPTKEVVEESKDTEANLSERLIALEGDQYGYISGYSPEGSAEYLYFDRDSIELAIIAPAAQVVAQEPVAKGTVESTVEEDEPQVEEVFGEFELTPTISEQSTQSKDEQTAVEFTIESPKEEAVVEQEAPQPALTEAEVVETPKSGEPTVGFEVEVAAPDEELSEKEITLELYDPTAELPKYRRPELSLMLDHTQRVVVTKEEIEANKDKIIHTLQTFGIKIDSIKATVGPTVTLYEIIPAAGVRISKIKNLEDDIALTLAALGIRIIAPIPGKGTIGIEVPNHNKETVSMHSVIRSSKFQNSDAALPIALGKTIQNETFVFDLAKMPHLLVAGATGQGKSVGLNAIITSLLYKKHPAELKFVLVDPKKVELTLYAKLEKHFLAKMEGEDEAIITDTQKVVYTLNSLCKEMDSRYDLLKMAQVRNISEYNDKFTHRRLNPEKGHRFLPYFVVVIDEFADLIMTAGREIETPIARIAQLARAVGIHLIIATQRPTTNIITGVIKANFPARIAFRVTSMIDSRTILDTPGANQLIGRGDMLVSTGSETTRVQCAFIDTPEVDEITKYISEQRGYVTAYELPEFVPESEQGNTKDVDLGRKDSLFNEVARYVVQSQSGSASTIQRKFSIGFNRAGRIIDQLEASGIVGAQSGSKPRQVLIQDMVSLEMMLDD